MADQLISHYPLETSYRDLLRRVSEEVNALEVWPFIDPDIQPVPSNQAGRLNNQLYLLHIAVIVVSAGVPLMRLPIYVRSFPPLESLELGESAGGSTPENPPIERAVFAELKRFPVPDNLFRERSDAGIAYMESSKGQRFVLADGVSLAALEAMAGNPFKADPAFSIDLAAGNVHAVNTTAWRYFFARKPVLPTPTGEAAAGTLKVPLQGNDITSVVQLAAAHAYAVRGQSFDVQALHQSMSTMYNAGMQAQPTMEASEA